MKRAELNSYLVLLSLLTDPTYVAMRFRRKLAALRGGSAAGAERPVALRSAPAPTPAEIEDLEIDLIYPWVEGQDPVHRAKRDYWVRQHGLIPSVSNADVRYVEDDELRYSLRSAELFLPWVRQIVIVTDNQVPAWLDVTHPRIRVVDHSEYMKPEWLPTFNTKAITAQFYRIEGLAEHFIYANDDMFFGQPCSKGDFFTLLPGSGERRIAAKVMLSQADDDWIVPSHWIPDPQARIWMAGWNNLKVTLEKRRPWRKIRYRDNHQPQPLTKSALRDSARLFPRDFERTCAHKFRHEDDINFMPFTQYRCLLEGTSVTDSMPSRVFRKESELRGYSRETLPTLFCINDGPDRQEEGSERELQRLFSEPSSFELPVPAQRGAASVPAR